jgi:hypothetical protein
MNPKIFVCHFLALTLLPTGLFAAKNTGGSSAPGASKGNITDIPDLSENYPSPRLKNLLDVYLEAILSPLTAPSPKLPSTEVASLRAALSASFSGTQTPARQQVVKNALSFCSYMTQCIDDRTTSLAKMKSMAKTNIDSGATDIHSNLKSGGVDAGAKAKAKLMQQKAERKDLEHEAKAEQNSFVANFQKTRVTSTVEMRKTLFAIYTRQLQLEGLAKQEATAPK